ncbi:CHASE2 domain-containing protein [Fulvimarina manganoxydans]|uniref:CHASE2 domain-containing protein n=1 Tax=Fulvimarina manganoxydans TaxID=937218 RepID=UPI002452F45F|nr:adenylate/guanylate cyclase domain-containing protein [Fulvimarina manganoxydans]
MTQETVSAGRASGHRPGRLPWRFRRRADRQPAETSKGRRRLVETLVVAVIAIAAALSLSMWQPFRMAEARYFDYVVPLFAPDLQALSEEDGGVVIVAIDEPSFAEIGLQWPWPRALHGQLVEALRNAGAKAVGLDLIFAEPSSEGSDEALAASLGPDVVLAADESIIETPHMSQLVRTEPLPMFLAKGARAGLASVVLDRDGVLRRIPAFPDGFAAEILTAAGESPQLPLVEAAGRMVQTMGPARSYPTISYYQALDPKSFLPPDFLKDKIVLVGRSLQMSVASEVGGVDSFASSETARDGFLVPGVEMQATILDNLRHGLSFGWASTTQNALLIALFGALAAALAWRPADLWTLAGALALILVVVAVDLLALQGFRLFLPPLAPSLCIAGVLAPLAARDIAEERRMRRDVTRAFGHYLAPAMVDKLARDPKALKLGGERRELTILFSDVRNFTVLAESMKDEPERLTQLINRLLTPLSDAVLERGGTIDKFIGDCIMAFWNAPLDDPDHARRAVEAGLAMLASVEGVNRELREELGESAPALSIGVGINSGICVVGNMGSSRRFDYSVLGDAVNYASRLEGASKSCAVPLLLGETTATQLATTMRPVLVDRISVKGRSGVAPVYTVLSGASPTSQEVASFDAAVERLLTGEEAAQAGAKMRQELEDLLARIAERERQRRSASMV